MILKKLPVTIVGLGAALFMWQTMQQTCPSQSQHMQTISDVVRDKVDKLFISRIEWPEESKDFADYLSSKITSEAMSDLQYARIRFDDYGIVSVVKVVNEDSTETLLSLGVLGKVMTMDEDSLENDLDKYMKNIDIHQIIQSIKH